MELSQLVSPTGPWHRAWLAAHWDKKLKKQDYDSMDVRFLIASFLENRAHISLRAIGHLLVGVCKIYMRKCSYFEDDAIELRTRLMMVFSTLEGKNKEEQPQPGAPGVEGFGPTAIREVDPAVAAAQGEAALASGRRHVARLEDITLREQAPSQARVPKNDDLFGAMDKELKEAMCRLREIALPPVTGPGAPGEDAPMDTVPLIDVDEQPDMEVAPDIVGGDLVVHERLPERPLAGGEAAAAPLPMEMDLLSVPALAAGGENFEVAPLVEFSPPRAVEDPALAIDALFDDPADDIPDLPDLPGLDAAGAAAADPGAQVVDANPAKRRRRAYFVFDESPEISKETYNSYVNDRSGITRKSLVDYSVFLPHYSPAMPNFTTTFTDLCPSLVESLMWGTEVAEKRRRLMQLAEGDAKGDAVRQAAELDLQGQDDLPPIPDEIPPIEVVNEAGGVGFLSPFGSAIPQGQAGLLSAGAPAPATPTGEDLAPGAEELKPPDEEFLLTGAPTTMGGVVTATMDEEDQTQNQAARIGYSGRTEKMHRFLAREFRSTETQSLSYDSLCRMQSEGRRELIAGCFFELLVLRTNGVIGLQQENPLSDIRISKANSWAKQ